MDRKIIWSYNSRLQLDDIFALVSRNSTSYATGVVKRIEKAVDRLASIPRLGRKMPEIDRDDFREILVYRWRVVYRIRPDEIEVIGIIHGAQRK